MARIVGLDFGTTNSALAIRDDNAAVRMAGFPTAAGVRPTFRSILFFDADEHGPNTLARPAAGGEAIARYLDSGGNGRLLLSLKSFLADRTFSATDIFGRRITLEELIALILVPLRRVAELQFGDLGRRLIGRCAFRAPPMRRTRSARCGVCAPRWQSRDGRRSASNTSRSPPHITTARNCGARKSCWLATSAAAPAIFLLRVTPRGAGTPDYEILGSDGVAIAGDAFDGRIVHHLVAPELGLGASYRTPYGKILPMPTTFYSRLERWHYLSMLKAPATMNKLRDLESQALEPQKIASFIHIVANDLAYSLFVAVERAKVQLSERDAALFAFTDPPLAIEKTASRPEFERWIGRERDEIARCVDGLVVGAGIQPARVDTVFLTGGSSFVPAIRQIFSGRFESATIRTGDEFISVAGGLALRAQ